MKVKNMEMKRLMERELSPPKSAAKNPSGSVTRARVIMTLAWVTELLGLMTLAWVTELLGFFAVPLGGDNPLSMRLCVRSRAALSVRRDVCIDCSVVWANAPKDEPA